MEHKIKQDEEVPFLTGEVAYNAVCTCGYLIQTVGRSTAKKDGLAQFEQHKAEAVSN